MLLLPRSYLSMVISHCAWDARDESLVIFERAWGDDPGRAHKPSRPRRTSAPLFLTAAAPIGKNGLSRDGCLRTKMFHLEHRTKSRSMRATLAMAWQKSDSACNRFAS